MGRPYNIRLCKRCNGVIVNRKGNAIYCKSCSEERKEEHREYMKDYMKDYNKKLKERK